MRENAMVLGIIILLGIALFVSGCIELAPVPEIPLETPYIPHVPVLLGSGESCTSSSQCESGVCKSETLTTKITTYNGKPVWRIICVGEGTPNSGLWRVQYEDKTYEIFYCPATDSCDIYLNNVVYSSVLSGRAGGCVVSDIYQAYRIDVNVMTCL